jgi:hypothetical protein
VTFHPLGMRDGKVGSRIRGAGRVGCHGLRVSWRRLLVVLHRDVGYLCAGLTVIYAVSGIAVNHIESWNSNYDVRRTPLELGTLPTSDDAAAARIVLDKLHIADQPRAVVRISAAQVRIFLEDRTLTLAVPTGHVEDEQVSRRPILFQMNFLHLNRGKGLWTWLADAYGAALLLLALSGIVILRGPRGLGGRGKWLVLAGLAIPLLFLWWKA